MRAVVCSRPNVGNLCGRRSVLRVSAAIESPENGLPKGKKVVVIGGGWAGMFFSKILVE